MDGRRSFPSGARPGLFSGAMYVSFREGSDVQCPILAITLLLKNLVSFVLFFYQLPELRQRNLAWFWFQTNQQTPMRFCFAGFFERVTLSSYVSPFTRNHWSGSPLGKFLGLVLSRWWTVIRAVPFLSPARSTYLPPEVRSRPYDQGLWKPIGFP